MTKKGKCFFFVLFCPKFDARHVKSQVDRTIRLFPIFWHSIDQEERERGVLNNGVDKYFVADEYWNDEMVKKD